MKPVRFTFFPSSWRSNPYLDLLQDALEDRGACFVSADMDTPTLSWLFGQRGSVEVLHFHWLRNQYDGAARPWIAAAGFVSCLVVARLFGYRIIWTMHNLVPHETCSARRDRYVRCAVARLANAVLVHCESARGLLREKYGRRDRVFVTPMGTYRSVVVRDIGKLDARRRLGMSCERRVFLNFGALRGYKGIRLLLRAFDRLPEADVELWVVGRPADQMILRALEAAGRGDCRVRSELKFVSDERLRLYLAAADVAVLPFVNVLSSSSAVAALSAGLPVVAPAMGCLPEIVAPDCGRLYRPGESDGLARALREMCRADLRSMSMAATARAAEFSWSAAAAATLGAYCAT